MMTCFPFGINTGDKGNHKQGIQKPGQIYSFALLKAQVSLQLRKVFSSYNGVSVSMMYSYMY